MSNKNPYTQAADAYGQTASATDQRSLEGRALMKAALKLEDLSKRLSAKENVSLEDISATLEYNHKLWTVFVGETMNDEHPLPQDIKNNIASLGLFVFKRTKELFIETQPEKLKALIDINRNIAAGLMKQPVGKPAATPAMQEPAKTSTDSMA